MFNPIRYIKDVIDILRNPPGEAQAALEIVPENIDNIRTEVTQSYGPAADNYVKLGDYYLVFQNGSTIVPKNEFHKHFAFIEPAKDEMTLIPVKTIKPL